MKRVDCLVHLRRWGERMGGGWEGTKGRQLGLTVAPPNSCPTEQAGCLEPERLGWPGPLHPSMGSSQERCCHNQHPASRCRHCRLSSPKQPLQINPTASTLISSSFVLSRSACRAVRHTHRTAGFRVGRISGRRQPRVSAALSARTPPTTALPHGQSNTAVRPACAPRLAPPPPAV